MLCPHCKTSFHEQFGTAQLRGHDSKPLSDDRGFLRAVSQNCPACHRVIVILEWGVYDHNSDFFKDHSQLAYPTKIINKPLPSEVPIELASDYNEAWLVLGDSPKASGALSRRCLQNLLRNYAKMKPSDLAKEIQELLDSKTLPSHIAEALDGVRNIGNFAAHPMKSQRTGEIVEVEPGEAEWNLETLEALFDFYFVQPARLQLKRQALNEKLKDAGKPPMKTAK